MVDLSITETRDLDWKEENSSTLLERRKHIDDRVRIERLDNWSLGDSGISLFLLLYMLSLEKKSELYFLDFFRKKYSRQLLNSYDLSLDPDNFLNNHDDNSTNPAQLDYTMKIRLKAESLVFNVENFVREKVQIISQLMKPRSIASSVISSSGIFWEYQIVERSGTMVIIDRKRWGFDSIVEEEVYDIVKALDFMFYLYRIPGLDGTFADILVSREENLYIYNRARDELIWNLTQGNHKIIHIPLQEDHLTSLQQTKNMKPNKNAYPVLFAWIMNVIFNTQHANHHSNEFLSGEASKLQRCYDQMEKEARSKPITEDMRLILALKPDDFDGFVRNRTSLSFQVTNLREKLCEAGINQEAALECYQKFSSTKFSFTKIYKLKDQKEIYFWATLMTVVLRELPIGCNKIRNSSFIYWILQNPRTGLELKMNILSSEMRKHYYQTIKNAQQTLLRKFEDSDSVIKNKIRQTREIIGENPNESEVESDSKKGGKAKRLAIQDLQQEELRPVQKVQVSHNYTVRTIIYQQSNRVPEENQQVWEREVSLKGSVNLFDFPTFSGNNTNDGNRR